MYNGYNKHNHINKKKLYYFTHNNKRRAEYSAISAY